MSVATSIVNNVFTWRIEGELDLSAGAAVVAIRGDNMVAVKTATGQYTVTIKNSGALQVVELLNREASFTGTGRPVTALGVTLDTVIQNATTGDIAILITTLANATSGANTDGTAAVSISFGTTIRIGRVNSPI